MKTHCFLLFLSLASCGIFAQQSDYNSFVIANGQMPNIARDYRNNIHVIYGSGDSIMYVSSTDGRAFTSPFLVAILPDLFASAMRGPQITASGNALVITACTKRGNIYSYKKDASGKWTKALQVNDVNEVAKEALMGLGANGLNVYAAWLGVKSTKGQNLYGAKSVDGGKTWSKSILVYASPDSTICECCKPSVAVEGNNVYVMFRNWLNGNRDMYLIKSSNGGMYFETAQKLGNLSWKLSGCPMDGGGLVISKSGVPETVWRRETKIYSSKPGESERELGEGRSCSIESIGARNIYAWNESGNVIVLIQSGRKLNLGKGSLPLIKAVGKDHIICIYENEKQIHASLLSI